MSLHLSFMWDSPKCPTAVTNLCMLQMFEQVLRAVQKSIKTHSVLFAVVPGTPPKLQP